MADPLLSWDKWGPFAIPAVGVIVLTLLLLVGSLTNIEQANFVQKVVIWVLGSGIISYAHKLEFTTKMNREEGAKDLSPWVQRSFIGVHAIWFFVFAISALPR